MADQTPAQQQRSDDVPSPEAVDSYFELLTKADNAGSQCRILRSAEYFGRAAALGTRLWGDSGSLFFVHAMINQSISLFAHVQQTAGARDDAASLLLEASRVMSACRRILNERLNANTCLQRRCLPLEEDLYARYLVVQPKEPDGETLSKREKEALISSRKRAVGYEACLKAAYYGLEQIYPATFSPQVQLPPVRSEERKEAQAFALRCLGSMATATHGSEDEDRFFVKTTNHLLANNHLEQPFKSDLARAWGHPALQNALRARRIFQTSGEFEAQFFKHSQTFVTRKDAGMAKHGLRWCALPSCAKQETNVFDFKACSACKAVVYCSAEHGALHWSQSHRKECASLKAAGAKPRSTVDADKRRAG